MYIQSVYFKEIVLQDIVYTKRISDTVYLRTERPTLLAWLL